MLAKPEIFTENDLKRDRVLDAIARSPLAASPPNKTRGRYYIVTTLANHEGIVCGHMIARRFGLYQPRKPSSYVIKGRKRQVMRSLAPGYLFVMSWDIERDYRLILSIPGVTGIISTPIPDEQVNKLRAAENRERPMVYMEDVVKVRKRRKKYSQVITQREATVKDNEIVSVTSYSAWAEIAALAEPERIGKLHAALGLAAS